MFYIEPFFCENILIVIQKNKKQKELIIFSF